MKMKMKMKMKTLALALASLVLAGCFEAPDVTSTAESTDVSELAVSDRVPTLSVEELAQLAVACPAPNPGVCPSNWAPTLWSSQTSCGTVACEPEACCLGKNCSFEGNERTSTKFSFRKWFGPLQGQECTEYRLHFTVSCTIAGC